MADRVIITPEELRAQLGSVRVIAADWVPSWSPAHGTIAGATLAGVPWFDIDAADDTVSDLPHMCPTVEGFERYCTELGIGNEDDIVVYDTQGNKAAAAVRVVYILCDELNPSLTRTAASCLVAVQVFWS
jgi:thiosulfate/3-mercaptopyruvate sulfurtransferase